MPELRPVPSLSDLCIKSTCQLFIKVIQDYANVSGTNLNKKVIVKNKPDLSTVRASQLRENKSQMKLKSHQKKIDLDNGNITNATEDILEESSIETTEKEVNVCNDEITDLSTSLINKQKIFIDELSDILCSLKMYHLHWSLFTTLINLIEPIHPKTKKLQELLSSFLPKFINSRLKELDFGKSKTLSETTMCQAIFNNLHNATELERLIIPRSCYWRKNIFTDFKNVFPSLSKLKVLHIHYICTPCMIEDLSTNCPLLEELNLHGSENINDDIIPRIAMCKNLKTLVITGTKITGTACKNLLFEVDSLQWLEHCAFNCHTDYVIFESREELLQYINKRFHQLQENAANNTNTTQVIGNNTDTDSIPSEGSMDESQETNVNLSNDLDDKCNVDKRKTTSFNLRHFWLFNPNSQHMLLTLLCPVLEHLRLDFIVQDLPENPDIEIVSRLTKLTSLTLNLYDSCRPDLITPIVDIVGTSLTKLQLHLADDWFFVAPVQNIVVQFCPNLISLTMEGDYEGSHPVSEADERLDFSLPENGLPKLESLRMTGCVTSQRLIHLITQSPVLNNLYLDGQLEHLSDQELINTLNTHPLCNLQNVWINVTTSLTLAIIHHLLKAENKLCHIGRLCHFNSSSKEEYKELLEYIQSHNLDTTLVWVTDQRF